MAEQPISHIILAIYGDADPRKGLSSGDDDADILTDENPTNVVAKAFDKARLNHLLGKAPLEDWNEEIGELSPRSPAKPFAKSSEERFAKTCSALKKIFGDGEDYEQAVELAKKIRDEARAEIVASH